MVPEPPRYTERGADQVAVSPVRSYLSRLIHACAPLMDGLGHATLSGTVPVSRARTLSFQKNRHFVFHALVALKCLVSLLGRLVACSARIVLDTQTNYCNPRCAC